MEVGFAEATGSTEGSKLAITVPGGGVRGKTEGTKKAIGTNGHRADCRLGGGCLRQCFFLGCLLLSGERSGRINQVGQAPVPFAERLIRSLQRGQHFGKMTGKVPEHAGILGALPREEQCQPAWLGYAGKAAAVGCHPLGRRVVLQHRPCLGCGSRKRGTIPFGYQCEPELEGGVEGGPGTGGKISCLAPGSI